MSILEKKEKNLNDLLDKLGSLTSSYTQSNSSSQKILDEKKQLFLEKKEIESKNIELMREHKYLKDKLYKLQEELKKKSEVELQFNQEIDELSQETESLVKAIEKWQT